MNSRERLLTALNHKESDRVPIDIGGTLITGINIHAYRNLIRYLGINEPEQPMFDVVQQLVKPSEAFLQRFHIDVRNVSPSSDGAWKMKVQTEGDYQNFVDQWGIKWRMPLKGGFYYDMAEHPLAKDELTLDDVKTHPFPDVNDPSRYASIRKDAQGVRDRGYGVVMSSIGAGILELGGWLRGYENFYTDLLLEEDLVNAYLDRILETKMAYWSNVFDKAANLIDVVQEADDLGSQGSMLIAPETYRQFIKPRHKILFDFIHSRTDAKIFMHSCGSFVPVIPDLIEVGLDILNPVQYLAVGMDAVMLKKEFGRDLVFWGGGVDTQRTLPQGTAAEVKENVRRQIEVLAPGGGFVFNTVHNIQADVPPQNLVALFEAFEEFAAY